MLCDLCATGAQLVKRRQALTVKYNQRLKIIYKYMHIFNNYTQTY